MVQKRLIIGIDEAGRGPLAGPVAVGAVSIRSKSRLSFTGLRDSKKLSAQKREEWFAQMKTWKKEGKIDFVISLVSNTVIDEKGIVPAVSLGITR